MMEERRHWWWIWTKDKNLGKEGIKGPFPTSYQAHQIADKLEVDSEVIPLPTQNENTATRILKNRRQDEEGYYEGTKHFVHTGMD